LTREKDMALALKTPYLRIEAPVPGEALVGLEVPSPSPSKVHLREVIETPMFKRLLAKGGLPIALGQDTGGSPVVLDLAALPHMLIAGATGSGKSVCINSIVASFLLTKTPEQLRILMVDPKRVELTPFNGIPHLIGPVIVDADNAQVFVRPGDDIQQMVVDASGSAPCSKRNVATAPWPLRAATTSVPLGCSHMAIHAQPGPSAMPVSWASTPQRGASTYSLYDAPSATARTTSNGSWLVLLRSATTKPLPARLAWTSATRPGP
jgi:hypothetical protein